MTTCISTVCTCICIVYLVHVFQQYYKLLKLYYCKVYNFRLYGIYTTILYNVIILNSPHR